MDAIARRAGVGERTLYRRFPTKAELVRAALDQSIAEDLTPAIHDARRAEDPLRGLAQLMEAAISLGAREHNILAAARRAARLPPTSRSRSTRRWVNLPIAPSGPGSSVPTLSPTTCPALSRCCTASCGRWIRPAMAGDVMSH